MTIRRIAPASRKPVTLPQAVLSSPSQGVLIVGVDAQRRSAAGSAEPSSQRYWLTTRSGRALEITNHSLPAGGLVRTFTDVTRHIEGELARERLHQLLQATQAMAQVGGWDVDIANNTVLWTAEVYKMLEVSPDEYTPTMATIGQFFTPESARKSKADVRAATRHSEPNGTTAIELEVEMLTARGRRIWTHVNTVVTQVQGRIVKRVSVMQDITERKRLEAASRANEENFRQITSQIPGMVFRLRLSRDGARTYSFVSDGVRELYGVEPAAVLANAQLLEAFRHPDDSAVIEAELLEASASLLPMIMQFRIRLTDGTVKWVQISSTCIAEDDGGTVRSGIMTEITARKQIEQQLHETEERWKLALDSTGDGVWDWHIQAGQEHYSTRYKEMYGYDDSKTWTPADAYVDLVHPDDKAALIRDQQAHFRGDAATYSNEHRVRRKDGSWQWALSRGMVISRDAQGQPVRMIGTHTDISQRKLAEALIWQQANFDPLTGLPNRRMLRNRLEANLAACTLAKGHLAVLFIDLDHFKEVNDTLGHDSGDLLLVQAARRIERCVGPADTVARMGGDEFTVVLSDVAASDGLSVQQALAQRLQGILDALCTVFELQGEQVFVSASMGVTLYPDDAMAVENLFKHADQALYVAKGAGRNRFCFFTHELQEAAQTRARLASDLRSGLAQSQFEVVYQPIVALATGRVHKAEALLRWNHPVRGLVSPAQFIGIAESSGLIIEIGEWVFRQVATQAKRWNEQFQAPIQISINKSPVQFHHDGKSARAWIDHLRALGLPGASIGVEITENLLLDASADVTRQLSEMRAAGIQISLDDFGTGYSSLSYLQKFDIDYIKIDQSFIRNLVPASTDHALCKVIIVMAHELGMKVIAEGIETQAQHDLLLAAGCDFGQGYLMAPPMTALDFEGYMRRPLMAIAEP